MEWQIYIVIAIIFWAVGQVLIRKGFENSNVTDTFFMGGILGFLVYIPYILLHFSELNADLFLFICCAFVITGYLVYYKALSVGIFSINNTIVSAFPIITLIFAQIFLDEPLSTIQWLGVITISVGIVLLSYFEQGGFSWKQLKNTQIKWPIAAAIYIGFGDFLTKVLEGNYSQSNGINNLIENLNSYNFSILSYFSNLIEKAAYLTYSNASMFFYLGLSQLLIGTLIKFFKDSYKINLSIFKRPITIWGNFLLSAGTLFFYLALFSGWASLVVPISASHVIFAVILAHFFLKEKLGKKQYFVILLIVLGNILVNL